MPAGGKGALQCAHVFGLGFRFRQKVEYRSVVPHVEGSLAQVDLRDITSDPSNRSCTGTEALSSYVQCRLGQVQHRETLDASLECVVDERGGATANVEHSNGR